MYVGFIGCLFVCLFPYACLLVLIPPSVLKVNLSISSLSPTHLVEQTVVDNSYAQFCLFGMLW